MKIVTTKARFKQQAFFLLACMFTSFGFAQATYTYNYSGSAQTLTVPAGSYSFQCWGANGADGTYYSSMSPNNNISGGKGGYSTGTFSATATTTLYIYVGGKGTNTLSGNNPGGYNGGGNSSSAPYAAGSGGGASHIATASGILSTLSSNTAAVRIVAGGGGGGGNQSLGGDGGGLSGVQPPTSTQFSNRTAGGGGSQTAAGSCYSGGSGAGFGQGGTTTQNLAGGGGGGWYGGCTGDNSTAGGGGSGYIGGVINGTTVSQGQSGFITNPVTTGNGLVIIKELCGISLVASTSNTNAPAICAGQSVTLTTNAVSGYSWSNGATTSSIVVSPTATTVYSLVGTSSLSCQASAINTINVAAGLPTISVVNTASTNNGVCPGNTVMLTASSSTASGLTSLSWNNSITNGTAFTLSGGNVYSVTATNACGSTVAAISLSVLPTPTLSAAVSVNTLCSGTSLTTTATGAATYTWSHGYLNNQGFFPSSTANYVVVGTAANGCTAQAVTSQVTVVLTPTAIPTVAPPLICIGSSATLNATGAASYTWLTGSSSSNANQLVVSPTITTTYTVIKLNANCSDTKTVTVIVNQLPALAALVNPSVSCASKPVTLTAIGTGTTYTWSPSAPSGTGAGSVIVTPSVNTVYTLTVSDGTCVNVTTNSVQVNPNPTITVARSSTAICVGQSATMTLSGGINYTWTAPASASLTGSLVVVSPTTNTSYQLIGDNAFSCTSAAQSVIIVNNNPTITVSSNPTLICVAGTSTIGASGANTYAWNTSAQTASTPVNALSTTVYTVTGTYTATGCNSSKTVQVAVFEPTFGVSGTFSSCVGGSVTLTGTGALSYTWNGNYPFQVFTASPPGPTVYMVTAQSMSNNVYCNSTQSVNISIYQNPTITAVPQRTLICNGESVDLFGGGGATYIWSGSQLGGSLQGGTVNVSPTRQATYTAVGTDSNGCVGTATTVVKVSSCQGVSEMDWIAIKVYPNPSSGNITVEANRNMTLQLINELGQIVKHMSIDEDNGGKVNIENLAPGLYFLVGDADGRTIHAKVLIE